MLTTKVKLEIMRHANEVYPAECCGVVTQKSRAMTYHPIDNVHRDPENHFELDAQQYAEIMDENEVIAVVHSHTGDGATTLPSAHDTCICNEMGIPWVIVSLPEGDLRIVEPAESPLIGRPWSIGSYDCYGLVMDWHKLHGIILTDYRLDYEWWNLEHGMSLYKDFYLSEGFVPTNQPPQVGDMIIMQLQSTTWNHAGIYTGENTILHHMHSKLSREDIYSGWLADHTVMVCRHKDLKL
ncbi:tail tip assembly protein K [Erwinia phage Snitter]|nr:tail tip assembly protein K [Erwinia phage Snitter]